MGRIEQKAMLLCQEPGKCQPEWELTDTNTKMTQILELSGKDFEAVII